MRTLPIEESADQMVGAFGAIVISQVDFEKALTLAKDPPKGLESYFFVRPTEGALRYQAAKLGGMANKKGTLGILADIERGETPQYFHSNLFIVVKDQIFDDSGRKMQATDYDIVSVEMAGVSNWIGNAARHGVNSAMSVGGRCCGPSIVCQPNDPGGNPGDPILMKKSGFGVTNSPNLEPFAGLDRPPIVTRYWTNPMNSEVGFDLPDLWPQTCFDLTGKLCTNVKPTCFPDEEGFLGGDGGGDIDGMPGPCGGPGKSIVIRGGSALDIPDWCKYAYFADSACVGFHPETRNRKDVTGALPLFCHYATFIGEDNPCNPARYELINAQMQVESGWVPGRSSKLCTPTGDHAELQSCTVCDKDGNCVKTVEKSPYDPIANRDAERDGAATKPEEKTANDQNAAGRWETESHSNEWGWVEIKRYVPPPSEEAPEHNTSIDSNVTYYDFEPENVFAEYRGENISEAAIARAISIGINFTTLPDRDSITGTNKDNQPNPTTPNQAGESPATTPSRAKVTIADPVDIVDGSLVIEHTDLQFDGPVYPLTFSRYYRSQSNYRSLLGSNWTYNWDARIVPVTADNAPPWVSPWCYAIYDHIRAVIVYDLGTFELYVLDEITKLYLPQSGGFGTITRTTQDGWAKREPDGRIKIFDADGYLISDRDRLGNGFTIDYEPTPLYELYQAFCGPRRLSNAADRLSRRFYLLSYLVGEKARPIFEAFEFNLDMQMVLSEADFRIVKVVQFSGGPSRNFTIGGGYEVDTNVPVFVFDQEEYERLVYARDYLLHLAEIAARPGTAGVESIDGFRKKRPVKVTDDVGRILEFEYYKAVKDSSGKYDFDATPWAGLMKSVKGPVGTKVAFDYTRPPSYPADLNEAFLKRVDRNDSNTGDINIEPGLHRYYEFTYNFPWKDLPLSYDYYAADYERKYREYYVNIMGCCSEICGKSNKFGDPDYAALLEKNDYISNVADKIITITNTGHIEAETRFVVDPYDENLGKVIAQKYGNPKLGNSNLHIDSGVHRWKTKMPLMSFDYQDAGPDDNDGDRADRLLPEVLKQRYAYDKDLQYLQFRDKPINELFSDLKKPDDSFTDCKEVYPDSPICNFKSGEENRRKLPGYRQRYEYYDIESSLNYPGFDDQLLRTRLSPSQLRIEQLSDPAHNDLVSLLESVSQNGGTNTYQAKRIIGGRKKIKANSNRICSWVKTVDRDGIVNYYGQNYRGQSLVEAIQETNGQLIVKERLINADGLVIQERRETVDANTWNIEVGHTIYRYDEIDPSEESWNEWLPSYWSRRKNLIRVEEYATSGSVINDDENGNPVNAIGRFEEYTYEPLHNQMNYSCRGYMEHEPTAPNEGRDVVYWETFTIFDYQELSLAANLPPDKSLISTLNELQKWGFSWLLNDSGAFQSEEIAQWQLPLTLYGRDLNADDIQGYEFHSNPSQRARSLPIVIISGKPNTITRQVTTLQWAPHGRPSLILHPDGEIEVFEYFSASVNYNNPFGTEQQLAKNISRGYKGFLAKHSKLRLHEDYLQVGPTAPPSNHFRGPYKWLELPLGDPIQVMNSLGIAPEIIEDLVRNAAFGRNAGDNWLRTAYMYNNAGTIKLIRTDSESFSFTRDTDGRIKQATDPVGVNIFQVYNYLGLPEKITRFDTDGSQIGENVYSYDTEGNLLQETHQTGTGTEVIYKYQYTRDGLLKTTIDPEGLQIKYRYNGRKLVTGESSTVKNDYRGITYKYDHFSRVIAIHIGTNNDYRPGVTNEVYEYDGLNRLIVVKDRRGYYWDLAYSGRDLLTKYALREKLPRWEISLYYNELMQHTSQYLNGIVMAWKHYTLGGKLTMFGRIGEDPTVVTYDLLGRPAWQKEANGNVTIYTYREQPNRVGRATLRYNAQGEVSVSSFVQLLDPRGQPIETRKYGKGAGSDELKMIHNSFTYNGNGQLIAERDHLGFENRKEFNWLGWVTAEEKNTVQTGLVDKATFEYNLRGQLRYSTYPGNNQSSLIYNPFGELIGAITDGKPDIRIAYRRDKLGRITTRIENDLELHTEWDWRGDPVTEFLEEVQVTAGQKNSQRNPFITRTFDGIGRITSTKHTNPILNNIPEADRSVYVTREYNQFGQLSQEGVLTGQGAELVVRSFWSQNNSYQWEREAYYDAPGWRAYFLDTYDRAFRLIRKSPARGQNFILDSHFEWMGDFYTGRAQYIPGQQSPFREHNQLDGFGLPIHKEYRAIDILPNGQPRYLAEGNDSCPGGWNSAICGRPILVIDILRDAVGRIGSLQWQFGHQLTDLTQQHPRYWRGYTYTPQGYLDTVWEQDNMSGNLGSIANYTVGKTLVQVLAQNAAAAQWNYIRESNVGSPVNISNPQTGASRWQIQTIPSRGKSFQLSEVTLNGQNHRVEHNGLGQINQYGSKRMEYHFYLQQLALVRDRSNRQEYYLYDAEGRLISVIKNPGKHQEQEFFLYDGPQMVASFDESRKLRWLATWGPQLDQLIQWTDFVNSPNPMIPLCDHRNSIVSLWQPSQRQLTALTDYNPEGRVTTRREDYTFLGNEQDNGGVVPIAGVSGLPFGFSSAWRSGTNNLIWMRNRWYSPELGQFLSMDPLQFSANHYSYCEFDSINFLDPLGLLPTGSEIANSWDKSREESSALLEQWTETNPNLLKNITATGVQSFMDLGKGTVDVLRLGEGISEGTISGVLKDVLRTAQIVLPVLNRLPSIAKVLSSLPLRPVGNDALRIQKQGLFDGFRRFLYNNVTSATSRRTYWKIGDGANGRDLHHWFFPDRWEWVPNGLRQSYLNFIELPSNLNRWMGRGNLRELKEGVFRAGVALGAYLEFSFFKNKFTNWYFGDDNSIIPPKKDVKGGNGVSGK